MRVLSSVFFVGGSMAALNSRTEAELDRAMCFAAHGPELSTLLSCGDAASLKSCFAEIGSFAPSNVLNCYITSGCSEEDAIKAHSLASERCPQLPDTVESFGSEADIANADLKRRRSVLERGPDPTHAPRFAATNVFPRDPGASLFARATVGDDCVTVTSSSTQSCETVTRNGKERTGTCVSTDVPVSACVEGKTCSFDQNGTRVCMDLHDTLDVAGIIIAIIFGVAIVGSIAAITFLCCRDRKEQKRLTAKAEATALARAATKKKKAEQRTPLMAQREGSVGPAAGRGGDPFSDGAHS